MAGDEVVLRCTFRGTDTGGYVGRAPTGRPVEEWVVAIMHFEDDKVVREWIGADKLGMFIRLGVLDNPWPNQQATPADFLESAPVRHRTGCHRTPTPELSTRFERRLDPRFAPQQDDAAHQDEEQ